LAFAGDSTITILELIGLNIN
jgi:hypothetical protein